MASTSFVPARIDLNTTPSSTSSIRTLLDLVDHNAAVNGSHLFCIQAEKSIDGPGKDNDLRFVTHTNLKHALLWSTRWFRDRVHTSNAFDPANASTATRRPVALLMDSDLSLLFSLFSLVALGVPVLILSVRLSSEAIAALLSQTGTGDVVVSTRLRKLLQEASALLDDTQGRPRVHDPPSYRELLEAGEAPAGENLGRLAGVEHSDERNVLVLHTSGTTGLPKPIWCSHRYLLGYATCHAFKDSGRGNAVNVSTLPMFHGFGLVPPALSLSVGKPVCFPVSPEPPTGSSIATLIQQVDAASMMSVPSILEDICRLSDHKGIDCLARLQFVASGGGPLKLSIAEEMAAAGVKIVNSFGNTEAGPLSLMFVPDDEYDWHYFRLRKDYDIRLDEVPDQESSQRRFQMSVKPFGWNEYFLIQDEMVGNPCRPMEDLRPMGRTDDLIVMANGEKVVPRILEAALFDHASVRTAVVFGNDRSEIGVLIEPARAIVADQMEDFRTAIWPVVVGVNARMDAHSTISSKDMIIVIPTPGKSIPRSDKASVLRRQTYEIFAQEIELAYESLNATNVATVGHKLDYNHLEESLRNIIMDQYLTRITPDDLGTDTDLFELGMDSLQATRLRRNLIAALAEAGDQRSLAGDFIYSNPSISAMCKQIRGEQAMHTDRDALVTALIEQYTLKDVVVETSLNLHSKSSHDGHVVLLTGTTGSLGPHILAEIVADPGVARVICINRPHATDGLERQGEANRTQCLEIPASQMSKATFLQADISRRWLGLDPEDYADICGSVTHIIHNAWPVNFRRHAPSFSKQYETMHRLIELARSMHHYDSSRKPRILFVSSISVVGRAPMITGNILVAESAMSSLHYVNFLGYAEAKYVCERMLLDSHARYPDEFSAAIVRIGQLTGSAASRLWNPTEHFPQLVRTSQSAQCLPDLTGTHSWLPVDSAARALREISLSASPTSDVYHLENPVRQSWSNTMALLASQLGLSPRDIVPLEEWTARVGAGATTPEPPDKSNEQNENLLLDFFRDDFQRMSSGGVVLDMTHALRECPSLREMRAVDDQTIVGFVEKWRSAGLLRR